MSLWKSKREKINSALNYNPQDIDVQNVTWLRFNGTLYTSKKERKGIGVVVATGIWQNRYSASTLCKRIAAYGYMVLAIEAPQHYLNNNKFTLGEYSEEIGEAVVFLRSHGNGRVAVIGHSLGGVCAIFSSMGYNVEMESQLEQVWHRIIYSLEATEKSTRIEQAMEHLNNYEIAYAEMKQLLLRNLERNIKSKSFASCYVLLAPPVSVKKAVPGLNIMKHLDKRIVHSIFGLMASGLNSDVRKGWEQKTDKQGLPENFGFTDDNKKGVLTMQFIKTEDGRQFLEDLSNSKEPLDYLKILERLANIKRSDRKISLFQYYLEKYTERRPKMFVYGKRDLLLRPFMPFAKKNFESYYKSCGNATIHFIDSGHLFRSNLKEQVGYEIIQNDKLTRIIIGFIERNADHMWA